DCGQLGGGGIRFAGCRGLSAFLNLRWRRRAPGCALAGSFAKASAKQAIVLLCGALRTSFGKTRGGADWCHRPKIKQNLSPHFEGFGIFEGGPLRPQMTPGLSSIPRGGRIGPRGSNRPEPPSVLRVRADCGGRL